MSNPEDNLPAATEVVPAIDVGPLGLLESFDIRNGGVSDVRSVLCKATLPIRFHWHPVSGVDPKDALQHVSAYIRTAKAQLIIGNVGGTDAALRHKLAVVLGTARATMTSYYRLQAGDFVPGELAEPMLRLVTARDGTQSITIIDTLADNVKTALRGALELTAEDLAAIPAIHISSVGLPAVQGYSIEMTGHHYLSAPGSQSFKAYMVLEKAHWSATNVATYWSTNINEMRDILWHKAGHPISMLVKRKLAFDVLLPVKLRDAGAGPAASRLPAEEPALRAAGSYLTLMQTCETLFKVAKGGVTCDKLVAARDAVHLFSASDRDEQKRVNLPEGVPATVVSRATAIEHLQRLMDNNAGKVAFCYGFYVALSEQSAALSTGEAADTLKVSHSLSKLKTQSHASYIAGSQAYGDYASARNTARAAGKLYVPTLVIE